MPPTKGNSLVFGNIQMGSEVERMDDLINKLKAMIREVGYPTSTSIWTIDTANNKDEMNSIHKLIDEEKAKKQQEKTKDIEEEKKFGAMLKGPDDDGGEDEILGDDIAGQQPGI